jgi:hypothetical protein
LAVLYILYAVSKKHLSCSYVIPQVFPPRNVHVFPLTCVPPVTPFLSSFIQLPENIWRKTRTRGSVLRNDNALWKHIHRFSTSYKHTIERRDGGIWQALRHEFRKTVVEHKICSDFLYNFCLKHFSFQEELSEIWSEVSSGFQVKCPLFLSDFNENWISSTVFRKILGYQILSNRPVWVRVVPCGQTDGGTDIKKLIPHFCCSTVHFDDIKVFLTNNCTMY